MQYTRHFKPQVVASRTAGRPDAAEDDLGPGHLFSVDLEPSPWLRFNVAWSDDDALLRFLLTLKAA